MIQGALEHPSRRGRTPAPQDEGSINVGWNVPPLLRDLSATMTAFKSDLLHTLSERGYIHQISDPEGLDAAAVKGPISGYIGFDATATSLHAGSLIQIMMLHWMQQTGHKPIALMGGGTSMVGDPSFKDEARKLLTIEDIDRNLAGIKRVFANYLDFGGAGLDDEQCRLAAAAELSRIPARCRPAFLGQPHAVLRQRQDPAGPRAVAVLPRIQLHDPAGLRLRRAQPARRVASCRWAAPTSGATSSAASISATA